MAKCRVIRSAPPKRIRGSSVLDVNLGCPEEAIHRYAKSLCVIKAPPASRINSFRSTAQAISIGVMIAGLFAMLAYVRAFLIARHRLAVEAVALRQQLAVYKHKQPRPKLNRFDRLFWVVIRRVWVIKTPAALESRA